MNSVIGSENKSTLSDKAVLYIHGKGGTPEESAHYTPLFPGYDIIGFGYQYQTPWDAGREIFEKTKELKRKYKSILIIANSIGAFFSMHAHIDSLIERAYFISPVVDMEKLICEMLAREHVTEKELEERGRIITANGEEITRDYLSFVRSHPLVWSAPTQVLFGSNDFITSIETIRAFCKKYRAHLTIMEGGEHWFHTDEQMDFLDRWIKGERT